MNVYTVKVEHCNAEHDVEAAHGIECVNKFYGQHPEYFNDDLTYIILQKVDSAIRVRYAVSGRSPRHKIELLGML
jgi:hypothetical protein